MTKTDKSKHNICIASIKRSTIKPYDFRWTNFYESNSDFFFFFLQILLNENELFICSTIIDTDNYSILTTQRLLTRANKIDNFGDIEGAIDKLYGDFKGNDVNLFTLGQIELHNGSILNYFIETGKASMIMIHGLRTLIKIQKMTNTQIDNVTRNWNRQNEI